MRIFGFNKRAADAEAEAEAEAETEAEGGEDEEDGAKYEGAHKGSAEEDKIEASSAAREQRERRLRVQSLDG